VYSTEEVALKRVTDAIERLDASRVSGDALALQAEVAAVWALVGEIDPELARQASRYAEPAGR
jgi:hypothetical protein